MITKEIKKDVNFCIFQNGEIKKIFKILFQKNKPDFYIVFPYFLANEYQMGTMTIPKGIKTLPSFDVSKNRKANSKLPVKFSYHFDGNVHFKPINPIKALVSFAFKYDSISATPISDLAGDHIFSITFEGLEKFLTLDKTKKDGKTFNIISNALPDLKTFKITAYAGFSEGEVRGKYGNLNPAIITLKRPQLSKPFFIAIYSQAGKSSIQNGPDVNPFLVSMVGFRRSNLALDKDLSTLYLYTK